MRSILKFCVIPVFFLIGLLRKMQIFTNFGFQSSVTSKKSISIENPEKLKKYLCGFGKHAFFFFFFFFFSIIPNMVI